MRTLWLALTLGLCGAANAAPTCHTSDATFGSLGVERCAPVDGRVATKTPPSCADGSYAPDGGKRFSGDGQPKPHLGVDLLAVVASDVFAAADGVVIDVRNFPKTSGWQVNIQHGDRRVSRYFHLSETSVQASAIVSRGQKIGLSGKTGNARSTSCPHLHFEVRSEAYPSAGDPVTWTYAPPRDPIAWLAAGQIDPQASQITTR